MCSYFLMNNFIIFHRASKNLVSSVVLVFTLRLMRMFFSFAHREQFVLTDNTGMLYHYIVEGSMIRDGSKINAEVIFTRQSVYMVFIKLF